MGLCNTGKSHCRKGLVGKTYIQQHRNNDAEARNVQSCFHSFPTQTFTCSKMYSQKAGRHSIAIIDKVAMGLHDKQATLFRNTAHQGPRQGCFVRFGISQESFVAFSKEVWSILPGPYAPCLSRLSNTSLPLL